MDLLKEIQECKSLAVKNQIFEIACKLRDIELHILNIHEIIWSKPATLKPVKYDRNDKKNIQYGRYLVIRKDGKTHLEAFNGTGFAYNDNSIEYYYIPKIA